MTYLAGPNGERIIGTLERIPGVALIDQETATIENGAVNIDWAGGTSVDWDGQQTVSRVASRDPNAKAERVFVDEDGGEHLESTLVMWAEDDEDEE